MSQPQEPYHTFENALQVVIGALNASDLIESVEDLDRNEAHAEFNVIGKLTPESEVKFTLSMYVD